jgi:hypothetical protein
MGRAAQFACFGVFACALGLAAYGTVEASLAKPLQRSARRSNSTAPAAMSSVVDSSFKSARTSIHNGRILNNIPTGHG